ncbi:MAG TPA: cupredoxin domain-containing protein [Actinomycetota bacterium]|nr:cupredoxin domain-containing protein [Actinomycetota bacterium]
MTRRTAALSVFVATVALVACNDLPEVGDDEPEAAPTATAGFQEDIDETCAEVSAPEGAPAPVTMMDNFFEPPCIAVSSEQGVALTNAGNQDHNFTIQGTDLSLDVEPGEDEETDEVGDEVGAGTYKFFCRFHEDAGMVGTIVVE